MKTQRSKINKIKRILRDQCPHVKLVESDLPSKITGQTKLTFVEYMDKAKRYPVYHTRTYEHFIRRGFRSKSSVQRMSLYFVIFRNRYTKDVHYKFGVTTFQHIRDRFHKASDTWEYIGEAVQARTGTKQEIEQLELEMKKYCVKNKIVAQRVQDFSYGGKTELTTSKLPVDKLMDLMNIFTRRSFDCL